MELTAVARALKSLIMLLETAHDVLKSDITPESEIALFSDSQYVVKAVREWLPRWRQNSWENSLNKPVSNQDLWREIDARHHLVSRWEWVKGHARHEMNNYADKLATKAIKGHTVYRVGVLRVPFEEVLAER